MKNLVFIGDSLTEWFNWQRRFPEYHVINLGLSGEQVEGLLGRGNKIREHIDDPDYIFLMTGINNIIMEQYDITGPYRDIVQNLTSWYKRTIIVVQSILPVALEWISNNTIKEVNDRLEEIAHECRAEYLDIYSLFVDQKGNQKNMYLQDDGVHLSSLGYDIWAKQLEMFLITSF
jgi:lysophospholipase L1-like esterase